MTEGDLRTLTKRWDEFYARKVATGGAYELAGRNSDVHALAAEIRRLWEEREKKPDTLRTCGDCGVAPGQEHEAGCDVERCSWCGGQWIQCGHSRTRKHDPRFARWTGLWPGSAEAGALGIDLNDFVARGLREVFYTKPGRREREPNARVQGIAEDDVKGW